MKKILMFGFLLMTGVLLAGCLFFAPTYYEVLTQCITEDKNPGDVINIANVDYLCPGITPLPTPTVNIQNSVIVLIEKMCTQNTDAWKHSSNAAWLADRIGGDSDEWFFEQDHWTMQVKERTKTLLMSEYKTNSLRNLEYPGFGTLMVQLKNGKTVKINIHNSWQMPTMEITKLKLFCNE